MLATIAGLTLLHLAIAGPVPSGGDGGNWLALAHERLGMDVLTPGVTYPPVFAAVLAVLVIVFDPVPALVMSALLARVVSVLAVYIAMNGTRRITAIITAVLLATAAFQLEAYAWGAYPQILASGFGVLAAYYMVRSVSHRRRRDAIFAIGASIAVMVTHTLIGALLLIVLPLTAIHAAWVSADFRRNRRVAFLLVGLILVLGGVYLGVGIMGGEGSAVLNPNDLDRAEGIRLAVGESVIPWVILGLIGVSSLIHRHWAPDRWCSVSVGFGLLVAGTGVFLLTVERRSLLVAQVGLLMLATTELERWWQSARKRTFLSKAFLVLAAALIGSIVVPGIVEYRRSTDFYRIVDQPEIETIELLRQEADQGDVVLASRGRNTIPIGWWVEGITRLPTISGHDPRYLSFSAEIEEAEAANEFFESLDADESVEFIKEIDFVVLDKRGPDAQWLNKAGFLPLDLIQDTQSLAIYRVEP